MEVDEFAHRGRSPNINHNQQRSQSTESTESGESKASSMDYADRMQAQNHQSWANQLEEEEQDIPSQVNAPHVHNEANSPIHPPHVNGTNCSVSPPDLEPLAYQANQSADPQLWDINFNSISLFGTDEFLAGDAKDIVCSLRRIATFIQQRPLGDKSSQDIPQISEFGFIAWDLISSIYSSGWDKLIADNNLKTF